MRWMSDPQQTTTAEEQDMCAEVVSPSDTHAQVHDEARGWIHYGTRLVLVLEPKRRRVVVHRPGPPEETLGGNVTLGEDNVFDGSDVVAGWRLPVRELFLA